MTKPLRIDDEAREELESGVRWYEERRKGLDLRQRESCLSPALASLPERPSAAANSCVLQTTHLAVVTIRGLTPSGSFFSVSQRINNWRNTWKFLQHLANAAARDDAPVLNATVIDASVLGLKALKELDSRTQY